MITNSYYSIANNDYAYLMSNRDAKQYNNVAIQAQQVIEKYLKHLVYTFCIDHAEAESSLKTHNLVKLNNVLRESNIDLSLNRGELALIKDYYFNAKYPGDNFIIVTKKDVEECLALVEEVKSRVNGYMRREGYCPKCGTKLISTSECTNLTCKSEQIRAM